jgi:hypothetical protein
MVSDDVEVTTCHPDDDQSRRLSLRNLHGKYLIRLLDKESAGLPPQILPHGTQVKLKVRSSADLEDVLDVVRRWILFPRCRVTVSVDGASPVRVGFADPQAALRDALPESAVAVDKNLETVPKQGDVRIEQKSKGGVTVAYALRWSSYFREWEFLPTHLYLQQNGTTKFAGTCIEGVRVDFASPGFEQGYPVLAMANSVGQAAPKTNVARLGIEATAERKLLMSNIYGIYCQYIAGEIEALQKERCFSLTWALGEAPWLMAPLFADHTGGRNTRPVDVDALLKAFADVPFVALEEDGLRSGLSAHQLSKRAFFWTVDSAFFESAEKLIREVPTATAISKLSGGLGAGAFQMPQGPYLAAPPRHRIGQQLIFGQSEVDGIVIRRDQRRLDMRWAKKSNPPRWHEAMPLGSDLRDLGQRIFLELRGRENVEVYVARGAVEVSGSAGETSVSGLGRTFVLPGTKYCDYLGRLLDQTQESPSPKALATCATALSAAIYGRRIADPADFVREHEAKLRGRYGYVDIASDTKLLDALGSADFAIFDPKAWERSR